MSEKKVKVKLLYIHRRDNAWGVFKGEIEKHHYHLLQIEDKGGDWSPQQAGILDAQCVLLSFFTKTYRPSVWFEGDPIDQASEWIDKAPCLLSEDYILEIRERINDKINSFDFTLEHADIEREHLYEMTSTYTEHLKKKLNSNPSELDPELSTTIQNLENSRFKLKKQPPRDSSPVRK